jgi:hypothetical protein
MVPGRGGGPDLAEPLRQDGERAGRDAPVLERRHHVLDRPDLGRGESMGGGVRTGRLIVKRMRAAAVARRGTDLATIAETAGVPATEQTLGHGQRRA